jgi:hypothetical protein
VARQATPVQPLQATDDLWARAEEALKCDPVKKKVFEDYLEILGQRLDSKLEPADGHDRHKQLCQLIEVETKELEDKKWKFQVGEYTRDVADLFQRSFKAILSVKDLVNTAASSCPPAALACAGATVILTVSVSTIPFRNSLENSDQMCSFVHSSSSPPKSKSLPLLKACTPLPH